MDLCNPNSRYEVLADNVPKVNFATGDLLQNSPIVCGGFGDRTSQECIVIGKPEMQMIEKRYGGASVAIDHRTLWIVGGKNEHNFALSSTELIKLGQPSIKGYVPFTIWGHSMIQYDEKSIYIIGGVQNGSNTNKTWIVDPTNGFQIKDGPSLRNRRYAHGCAKMIKNGRTILVVAGGFRNGGRLDSVEILDPLGNNVWTPG